MNSYPLHIEKQQELLFKKVINQLEKMVLPKLQSRFKIDRDDFGEIENRLNDELRDKMIKSGYLAAEITNIAVLLDSWSYNQTKKAIQTLQRVKKKTAREILPILFEKESPLIEHFIFEYTKRNVQLVEALGKEYIPEVAKLAADTFYQGGDMKVLTEQLSKYTLESKNKAAFWAQDQVGDAYAQFTETRQTQAGFLTYTWRTVGDIAVRETHAELNGRTFTWKNGVSSTGMLDKPGAKNPGQDYRCRCTAEANIE